MYSAIEAAAVCADDVGKTFQTLRSAGRVLDKHCQDLTRIVADLKKKLTEKQSPYTGLVNVEETKTGLVALADIKKDLRDAVADITRLPPAVKNAKSGLPGKVLFEKQYAAFARLGKYLPEAEKMIVTLNERLESVEKEISKTTEFGEALASASASTEEGLVTQLADLNRSLATGRERLNRCHEMLASSTMLARNLATDLSKDAQVANMSSVANKIAIAGNLLLKMPEIPGMLEKAQAHIVRVIAILHQKAFVETVRLGMEAEDSAKRDSLVSREARLVVGLYARAHALNDTVTSENVLHFPDIELMTLDEELKTAATSAALANLSLDNAKELFEAVSAITETPAPAK